MAVTPRLSAAWQHAFDDVTPVATLAYGIAIGRAFFTESQFSLERDASKLGFLHSHRKVLTFGVGRAHVAKSCRLNSRGRGR
jgi:hypothetical protein